LCHLHRHLGERGFSLFDIQLLTPITRQLGAVTIPREKYLERLAKAVKLRCGF
jgi:leucyl/phenylalanyl-tRNA--protein transferase